MIDEMFSEVFKRWAEMVESCDTGLGIPTAYPNGPQPSEEERNDIWVELALLPGASSQISLGCDKNLFRYPAILVAMFYVPLGTGDGKLTRTIDKIKPLFTGVSFDSFVFTSPYPQILGRDGKDYRVNLNCPLTYDAFE